MELLIGLRPLDLPILQLLAIHDAVCVDVLELEESQVAHQINDFVRWEMAKLVKYFGK